MLNTKLVNANAKTREANPAETVGFEPTNDLHRYFLSREAPSTRLGHVSGSPERTGSPGYEQSTQATSSTSAPPRNAVSQSRKATPSTSWV